MSRTKQRIDRPPRYSRPALRILTPFIGVFGQGLMFPILLEFKSGSGIRPLLIYVIVDLLVIGAAMTLLLCFVQS